MTNVIIVKDAEIRRNGTKMRSDYINLTDMLKAKDGEFLLAIGSETVIRLNISVFGKRSNNPNFNYGELP